MQPRGVKWRVAEVDNGEVHALCSADQPISDSRRYALISDSAGFGVRFTRLFIRSRGNRRKADETRRA